MLTIADHLRRTWNAPDLVFANDRALTAAAFVDTWLAEVFEGDRDRQRAWMNAPRAAFGGRSALDMIRIGETKAVRRLVISEVDHSALEIAARD